MKPVLSINQSQHNILLDFRYLPVKFPQQADLPLVDIPLQVLVQSEGFCEFWTVADKLKIGECSGQTYSSISNEQVLAFAYYSKQTDIAQLTTEVYQQALQQAETQGFSRLIRTWNYFPHINRVDNGLERYQQFCVARQNVLEQFPQYQQQNPAATAIGSHNQHSCFLFLFAKESGQALENKRQIPAWRYPENYAPKQPRFSRAMVFGDLLICSGTASVIGHQTEHIGDVEKQLVESLKNIDALLQQAPTVIERKAGVFRFYLRNREDQKVVIQRLKQLDIEHYILLLGDVCRENLLIECEAVFHLHN